MSPRCKTCGVPLDEIPFEECKEHRDYLNSLPEPTEEEIEVYLDHEAARLMYERTGDD